MRTYICILSALLIAGSAAVAESLADCAGVIRAFGDQSSWLSACFVVGDGSWAVTTYGAVNEKVGPEASLIVRNPIFISAYTGEACQCEVRAADKDLNIVLLKLPIKGLPAAPLAQSSAFTKAGFGTMGELMSGDQVGNRWPTDIYGVTREKTDAGVRLNVANWSAAKVFVTDIGKYRWLFLSDVSPDRAVPNGSMIARDASVVGMYLNKLVITGGQRDIVFGRCAMSTEMARWLGDHGVNSANLTAPPAATAKRDETANSAFQLQSRIYSSIGAGRPDLALENATALTRLRPTDAQARMVLGTALVATGKPDDALKAYDEALKLDPKLSGLRVNRGLALVAQKKRDKAESELLKAAEESPTDIRPVIALANFYLADEKSLDKSYIYAQKLTTMAGNSPATHLLLAKVEKTRKKYQAAINAIGEALKLAPDWGDGWYALGSTFEEAGDKSSAEKAYRKLAEKQPKNPGSLMTLASFLADEGKKDEATELIAKVRTLNPPKEVLDAAKALQDKIDGKAPEK
ncbi:MAG: tetratricopeptide repeat protein [Armatimonadetes bacterium]|nr:tetratricopeptide repeat protein [Armatimonadota bacterium]